VRDGESRYVEGPSAAGASLPSALHIAALCFLAAMAFAFAPQSGMASEHLTVTGEYGKEGPKATGLGNGCRLAYKAPYLYLFSDSQIYGLEVSPGSATALAGNFPIDTGGIASYCTDPDLEVSQFNGNIFAVPSSHAIHGWSAAGTPLGPPWPVDAGGETCGVTVTASGEVWGGNYGNNDVSKFTSAGVANGTIPTGFKACKIVVDPSNNDLYALNYSTSEIVKFTASSSYVASSTFATVGNNNSGMAINGAEGKLYVGNGSSEVKVYDTTTGAIVETIDLGEPGGMGIAVDEATDTLFVTVGSGESGYIREYLGLETAKATTGEPTGNSEVSGIADPNGQGDITECYFELGTSAGTYSTKADCNESLPISTTQEVHANFAGLNGEETYHYRLVVGNGDPFRVGRGVDKTIVPHNVKGLVTDPATDVTQESATLNAHFEGTNEDTFVYFEYGRTTGYGKKSALPPGEDVGVTTGPTAVSKPISGLSQGVTYHYRVVAKNDIGLSQKTNDQTFTTYAAPTITSFSTKAVTESAADVLAKVNPNGFETKYHVIYGPTVEYGQSAPVPDAVLAAGNSSEEVTIHLTGLNGGTYHFRVVATSKWGTTTTRDQTFNFFPPSCPNSALRQQNGSSELPDCRAYELVSPPEAGNILLRTFAPPAPYATNPPRFLYGGYDGVIEGTKAANSGADFYVATRTATGWETKYTGIPGNVAAGPEFGAGDRSLDKFLTFRNVRFGCCQLPYVSDVHEQSLGRWPADASTVPGWDETYGAFQPSPDFSHLVFSTRTDFDPNMEGVTSYPGSVYDYDVENQTVTKISKTAAGDIQLDPSNVGTTELIGFPGVETAISQGLDIGGYPSPMYPGVSIDGSHVLMETKGVAPCGSCPTPHHLYMWVDSAGVAYEIAGGQAVNYVGMTSDGSKVFFTTNLPLTADDHDTSADMYMWSEEGELTGEPLVRISKGDEGKGDSDTCGAGWTTGCNVVAVQGKESSDYPIATESGDVYFYSPEVLDSDEAALQGGRNLYLYRGGQIKFVATLSADGSFPLTRIQVSPNGDRAAFVTGAKLTDFENSGFQEMYGFDPATGAIECSSCNPRGAVPTTNVSASETGLFMSDDGRTFFSTIESLVPRDTNKESDVYEYVDGRPQLITSGVGQAHLDSRSEEVLPISLMGVSPDGVDVYFSTFDTLVSQDRNGAFLKFYDARAGGGFPVIQPTPPCEAADECHGAGSSPPPPAAIRSNGDLGSTGNWIRSRHHKKRRHGTHRKSKRNNKSTSIRHGGGKRG
jgi:hypothetical protein